MSGSLTTSNARLRITSGQTFSVFCVIKQDRPGPSVVRTASPRLDLASLTMQVRSSSYFSFNVDLKSEFLVELFQAAAPDGTGREEKEERLPSAILRRKVPPFVPSLTQREDTGR